MSKLYYEPAMDLTDQLQACIGFSAVEGDPTPSEEAGLPYR
jgi:hypothetical protein